MHNKAVDKQMSQYERMWSEAKATHEGGAIREGFQIARNLTPEAKEIIDNAELKMTKKSAIRLSHFESEQQKEAAAQSEAEQWEAEPDAPPFHIRGREFSTFKEDVADLKMTEKDFGCTPDDFLVEMTVFARKFH